MNFPSQALFAGVSMILLAACSPPASSDKTAAASETAAPASTVVAAALPAPDVHPEPLEVPMIVASASELAHPVDTAA